MRLEQLNAKKRVDSRQKLSLVPFWAADLKGMMSCRTQGTDQATDALCQNDDEIVLFERKNNNYIKAM